MKKLIKTLTIIMSVALLFSCSQSTSSSNPDSDPQNPANPSNPGGTTTTPVNNGLDSTFTPEELPDGTQPFSGKKFGDASSYVEFLSDGTYKGVTFKDGKQAISIYDYTYNEGTSILSRRLKSSNNYFSDQTDFYTYQQVVDYFNSLNYADYASIGTEEEFKAVLNSSLNQAKTVFGTVETYEVYFVEDVNGNYLRIQNYHKTPNEIFTREWIRFDYDATNLSPEQINTLKLNTENSYFAYTSYGSGDFYVIKNSVAQKLKITGITQDTITAIEVDGHNAAIQNAKTYTFTYSASCSSGIITIIITGKDNTTQADLEPYSYKLCSNFTPTDFPEITN